MSRSAAKREQTKGSPTGDHPLLKGMCVVLFGMPAAGKSSLLGALAQAAQLQPGLLGGQLKDESGGLAELRKRVYDEKVQETLEEIVPYPVTFQADGDSTPIEATLVDCDGRIAHSYLVGEKPLGASKGEIDLAHVLEHADTLLLIVDGSVEPGQLKQDFAQFAEFLRWLEEHRSRAAEVAGLPVYLVLTKCDLLAKAKDSSSAWLQRIEEAKRKISIKFKVFLAEQEQREQKPFGRIDLHVWATAVKRPALADKPARASEPFGVAELFRQCFASGRSFQTQRGQAERRLQLAIAGVAGLLALLLLTGAYFFFTRPSSELTALANRAQSALPAETASPAERLKGRPEDLRKKIEDLDKIITHQEFTNLEQVLKDQVFSARQELKTYHDLLERFGKNDKAPEEFARAENTAAFDKFLREEMTIPDEYRETFLHTELKRNLDERLRQVTTYRRHVAETEGMLHAKKKEGEALALDQLTIGDSIKKREAWEARVRKYLEGGIPAPAEALDGLPELTYKRIYELPRIQELTRDWQAIRKDLAAKVK